ncbi:MAG: hypothetical protein ACUVWB_03940, partial [Anaerolineae bacterium]
MQTPEQGSSIDILQWIDQLEALLTEGWRIPFTANVVVDEHAVFEIIDQMRIRIPEELKQARRIQQQQERILAQVLAHLPRQLLHPAPGELAVRRGDVAKGRLDLARQL